MVMEDLLKAWRSLRGSSAWFAANPPEPGATSAQIAAAERRLGRALPPLLAALLQLSRGWSWRGEEEDVMWMAPEELALGARDFEKDIDWEVDAAGPGADAVYDVPERLSFAWSDARVFQIDFAPAVGGVVGQVVAFDPEEGRVDVVAASLADFVAQGLHWLRETPVDVGDAGPTAAANPAQGAAMTPAAGAEMLSSVMKLLGLKVTNDAAPAAEPDAVAEKAERAAAPATQASGDPAIGPAAKAFLASVERASPSLHKRLKGPLSAAKANAVMAKEGKAGLIPDTLLPLFAAFDGQKGKAPMLPCPAGHCSGLGWYSVQGACDTFASEKGSALFTGKVPIPQVAGVRDDFWNPRWVPLLGNALEESAVRTLVFVDFDPAPGGQVGQMVLKTMRWDPGNGYHGAERRVLAPSVAAWLEGLAADIDTGVLVAGETGFRAR